MKRRATGLLVAVTAVYIAVLALGLDAEWVPIARAGLEGSMVGGLADWFAVTALFRHPLGIPIPHTAVIRNRKDQFGATLGAFVQENFLSPDIVAERVRSAQVADRTAAWLVQRPRAETVSRTISEVLVAVLDAVSDEDVHRLLHDEIERAVSAVPLAPLAGKALEVATTDGRHQELLDVALRGIISFLDEQREPLRERFGAESPWWLPGALEDRLFDRIVDGARLLLASVVADPHHEIRASFDERIEALAVKLQKDPALRQRGEQLKAELLDHPELRRWTTGVWTDIKATIREQSGDPSSPLRTRTADAVVAIGARLQADAAIREKLSASAESAARYVAEHYRDEIGDLITATVSRWDPEETSDKLELLLGRDLQFIRINGTIVGGLAGLALHGLAAALG